jgi:hypothetical protein
MNWTASRPHRIRNRSGSSTAERRGCAAGEAAKLACGGALTTVEPIRELVLRASNKKPDYKAGLLHFSLLQITSLA